MKEHTNITVSEEKTTVPTAWLKWVLIVMLGGGAYAPYLFPQRGTEKRDQNANRSDNDNAAIIHKLTDMEKDHEDRDATQAAAVESLMRTCSELRDDVKALNFRVDSLYKSSSSSKSEWVPNGHGWLVPKSVLGTNSNS